MLKSAVGSAVGMVLVLLGSAACAEPVKLKLAYVFSDRNSMFAETIKPFVDAVNAEARDAIKIEIYSSGALGKNPMQQAQLVLDGTADITLVPPGAPTFADNAVVELPGLYQSQREASRVYAHLVTAGALRGFEAFYPVLALTTEPGSIHSRRAIASLDDLKGQKIRTSGPLESAAFAKLGIEPVIMPAPAVTDAISSGMIDGAATTPQLLQEFGIGRVASYHYMLRASVSPLIVIMNRKTFDSLPASAQAVIRRYGGDWAGARLADCCEKTLEETIAQLKSDPRRKVVVPTPAELDRLQVVFKSVINDWAAKDPHHQELLRLAEAEIVKFRARPNRAMR